MKVLDDHTMQKGLPFETKLGTETVRGRQSDLMLHIDVAASMVGKDGSSMTHIDWVGSPSGAVKTTRHGAVMVVYGDALFGKQVVFLELLGFVRFNNVPGGAGGPFLGLSKLTCCTFNEIAVGRSLGIPAWHSARFH